MREIIRKSSVWVLFAAMLTLSAGVARAEDGEASAKEKDSDAYTFGLAFTIGEGVYFVHDEAYRGPVSLEVVPSFGWDWFKFDFGVSTTLESVKIAGTNVGNWNFTFRPGARLTPPLVSNVPPIRDPAGDPSGQLRLRADVRPRR